MYLQKQLNDCTYYFDAHNSVYLIVGKERAAIIDTGMENAYSGHYLQRYRHPGYDDNPINIEMIDDAIKLCDMALNNSVEHQPSLAQNFGVPCFEVSYRHMTFVLNDQKLEREKNEENECTQNVGCS